MGNFKKVKTSIDDLYIIEPEIFEDNRGNFFESYNKIEFEKIGINYNFVQDNQSKSKKGVLRGLHYQKEQSQAKLIRCIKGKVFDVAVDLRQNSKTYGKWESVILSAKNSKMFMIPKGFAHGYLVLSKEAEIIYKCDDYYNKESEAGIMWNDPKLGINWPIENLDELILSDKDRKWPKFAGREGNL